MILDQDKSPRHHNRREFVRLSLTALAGLGALPQMSLLQAAESAAKPDSKVSGVQIGLNVPYSFANMSMPGEEVLRNCVKLDISAVELRAQPVEMFLGAPSELIFPKKGVAVTAENAERLADWRKSAPLGRVKEFRKMFDAAGVKIEILKVDGVFKMTDAELDYAFKLAKELRARAMSTEISHQPSDLERIGHFADKHKLMVGYHGHAETKPEHWEAGFALAKYNGANVDIGHFVAGNNTSPVPFIKEHHDRITHVHIKDRKFHNGPNTPFGQGDTPIVDVLHLLRDNKWNIEATIEFEYKVPAGSDRMTEIGKAIKYCRDALA